MSTDTHTDTFDPFEADLAARLGAATDTVAADGVTREGVDERVAAHRASRRRRQGGLIVAAAALVIAAGVGAVALGADQPDESVKADTGQTSEAPTTAAPTTETPTSLTECSPTTVPSPGETGPCDPAPPTTAPPTTPGTEVPVTEAPPATEPPTTAPPATDPPTTDPPVTVPPTTAPVLVAGQPCTAGSSPDCIDPEGDGSYTYLYGGAACMATMFDPSMCADLDGDGFAGYPDSQ